MTKRKMIIQLNSHFVADSWSVQTIIDAAANCRNRIELRSVYQAADLFLDRDEIGDELYDDVYYHLAIACERLGLDPLSFS